MAYFNIGEFVIGRRCTHGVVRSDMLCIVRQSQRWSTQMSVEIVGGNRYYSNRKYSVRREEFDACSLDEYLKEYPNAKIDYSKDGLGHIREEDIDYHMNMHKTYDITAEEKESLVTEMMNYLKLCRYDDVTKNAAEKIIDEWVKNKGWIISLFKNHPNYNGRYQIVFDEDYQRKFDMHAVRNFSRWISINKEMVLEGNEVKITAFSLQEAAKHYQKCKDALSYFKDIAADLKTTDIKINGKNKTEFEDEYKYFKNIIDKYRMLSNQEKIYIDYGRAYDIKAYKIYRRLANLSDNLDEFKSSFISKENADKINKMFDVNAVAGQKLSRVINKIMTYTGLCNHSDYNKSFTAYADAVNPLKVTRHTILSVHPIDFLTMSNGNSWTSCHSVINRGQYHSGTMSYMLDRSSFVYYTVDKSFSGEDYHNQQKLVRCMFHMSNDKIVQGRVYPQATDVCEETYLEIRNIVRRVLASCLDISDDWTIKKGCSACDAETNSLGTHYKDYLYNSNCNISKIKRNDKFVSSKKIVIGRNPICLKCGEHHSRTSTMYCGYCR